jgi:hypothetical protein
MNRAKTSRAGLSENAPGGRKAGFSTSPDRAEGDEDGHLIHLETAA